MKLLLDNGIELTIPTNLQRKVLNLLVGDTHQHINTLTILKPNRKIRRRSKALRHWTAEEDKTVIEGKNNNESNRRIGNRINRTEHAVSLRAMILRKKGRLEPVVKDQLGVPDWLKV